MFVLNSDITIEDFRFSGVNEVRIKKGIHSYVDTATIKLPSKAVIYPKTNSSAPQKVTTATKFKDGDKVTIKLGYNGDLQEEFRGFVKHSNMDMPLEIQCEGYSYLLRKNKVKGSWKSISVSDLLKKATDGLGITLEVTADIALQNVTFAEKTGAEVIDFIKEATNDTLSIFFIEPDKLWAGLVYTAYANNNSSFTGTQVNYRLGYNALKDNSLKIKTLDDTPTSVEFNKRLSSGEKLNGKSDQLEKELVRKYKKMLNHIASSPLLKQLAQEKQYQMNYHGYEGAVTAFLQPYCLPGYKAYIKDERYPNNEGIYAIESVDVTYGMSGARRKVEIGPLLGFANKRP